MLGRLVHYPHMKDTRRDAELQAGGHGRFFLVGPEIAHDQRGRALPVVGVNEPAAVGGYRRAILIGLAEGEPLWATRIGRRNRPQIVMRPARVARINYLGGT